MYPSNVCFSMIVVVIYLQRVELQPINFVCLQYDQPRPEFRCKSFSSESVSCKRSWVYGVHVERLDSKCVEMSKTTFWLGLVQCG